MLKIINPANGKPVRELEEDSSDLIASKARRARLAQAQWASRPYSERAEAVSRFAALLQSRIEPLARTLTTEMGKPVSQARNEIKATGGRIAYFLEHTPKVLSPETVSKAGENPEERISYEPLGVVANVSAWNYPYFVGTNVFIPALLTGNAVLYKPSEFATLTGLAIADLLHEAGVPSDVFIPVIGGGKAGADLLSHPVDGVFFTGSYATGTKIAEAASKKLARLQLELGGKDPTYVREDADVKAAAESLSDGAFYNTGQSCCSVERIYVQRRAYDAFVDAFVACVRGFKAGDPMDDSTYIGPLARAANLPVLEDQVKDAVGKGAKLLVGGKRVQGPGNYFEPTVLAGVNHSMAVMRDESFGPIIGIQAVDDDEEAIRLMNDTEYGLTAGVYTRDRARAEALMARVHAGSVYWNCCDRVSPRLPWTGWKSSGLGSTLSHLGILAFVKPKGWHLKKV